MSSSNHEAKTGRLNRGGRPICLSLLLWALLFSAQCAEATEYRLQDLYRINLERSERIRASKEDVLIAEQEKNQARAELIPKLSATASYTRFSTDKRVNFGSSSILIQPAGAASWGVGLEEALSLGGKEVAAYRISKEEIERSSRDLETVEESNLFTVAASYYDLLRGEKALQMARTNLDRLTSHRDAAAARLKVGEVTKTDLLRAEAELSGARSELVRAENVAKLAKAVLARTVGIPGDFQVKEPQEQVEVLPSGVEQLKETALKERSDLQAYSLRKKIAEERVGVAKSSYWPKVSVEGGYLGQSQSPTMPFAVSDSLWAGISVSIPIFDGGLRKSEVGQSEAKSRRSALLYEDLKKTVSVEVESAWLEYQTQQGTLQSLRDQRRFAADNYYSVSKQYQYGLANSIDVIDANSLLLNAERQLIDAEFNLRLALVRVQRATGVLLKDVLAARQ